MPFILAIFMLFSLPVWAEKPVCDTENLSYKGEWKECQVDSDCVEAVGTCGFAATVNSLHLEEASCYFRNSTKKQPKCIQMAQPPVKAVTCDSDIKTCTLIFDK